MKAAILGRDGNKPLRSDWDKVKDAIMRKVVMCKFKTYKEIKEILLFANKKQLLKILGMIIIGG
jgi:hypothetical protein